LSIPALRAIKQKYHRAVIDIVVARQTLELAQEIKLFNRIFVYEKGIFKTVGLLLSLRKNKYGLAINMRTMASRFSSLKMFLFLKMINAKLLAGRDTNNFGFFFDLKVPETEPGSKYAMEYDIDMARALGADCSDRSIILELIPASIEKVDKILEENQVSKNDVLIGIHPGGMPSRRWPLENFRNLIEAISKEMNCKFVITGASQERDLAEKLSAAFEGKVINLAGKLGINELSALIKRCNLFISNDTGPMHFAAVLKTPLLAIFGPGQLTRFDPRMISDQATVLYKKTECAPCNNLVCDDLRCLKAIFVREAAQQALEILKSKGN